MQFSLPTPLPIGNAAFFDLEKTLSSVAVEQDASLEFYRRGELNLGQLARVGWSYLKYNLGLIKDFESLKGFGAKVFTGRDAEGDRQAFRALFDERLRATMRPELLEAIGRFKEHDVDIYIVSSTYEFMVAPFAEAVGAIAGYGASLETEDGRCTGRLTGPLYHQQTKADLVRRLATERGYDLSGCWAFGDSVNDQAMLESVGHPVAICPSKGLRRVAVERGWQILDR